MKRPISAQCDAVRVRTCARSGFTRRPGRNTQDNLFYDSRTVDDLDRLAPVERDVVDENGAPLFRIGPTAWALVIEDRGDTYVVRHEDGRIGYLTDVSGVTRG